MSDYAIWHPFTQMARFDRDPQLVISRAKGNFLIDTDGKEYIDGVASIWANVHGHSHPKIVDAIQEQASKLQHSTLLGITHEPAIELTNRLNSIVPVDLSHIFLSENGASAVEVALKMAIQFWANQGHPERNRIIALEMAYHGDTVGAVSVGGEGPFRDIYKPLWFEPIRFPNSYHYRCSVCADSSMCSSDCAAQLRPLLDQHAGEIAALIIEPRVQGAAGIIVSPDDHLRAIRYLCDQYDILLIADEVATGFGKTGAMFACDLEQVTPDIMVLGKGITGGYLPLAATVTTDRIYDAFYGEESKKLFHGHTYAGNPICCAAGIASIDLFADGTVIEKVQKRSSLLASLLEDRIANHPNVGEIRQQGLMVGIELVANKETREPLLPNNEATWDICLSVRDEGLFIRPLGDVIVLMPPLSIEEDEIDQMTEALRNGIYRILPD